MVSRHEKHTPQDFHRMFVHQHKANLGVFNPIHSAIRKDRPHPDNHKTNLKHIIPDPDQPREAQLLEDYPEAYI